MYIKLPNIYPYNPQNLYKEHPNTSFPVNLLTNTSVLNSYEVYAVEQTPKPEHNPKTEKVTEAFPVFENGVWKQLWAVESFSEQEQENYKENLAAESRALRNRLLIESDWTQFKDINPQISNNWAPYRQQLRGITTQPGFPFEIVWPTPPA